MGCLNAYHYSLMGLERSGVINDPKYIAGASEIERTYKSSENVFCFSMSCAAHEVMQFLGYALDEHAVCSAEPKMFLGYTGDVFRAPTRPTGDCSSDCQIRAFESKALNLSRLLT
jgi:hypothetical protein